MATAPDSRAGPGPPLQARSRATRRRLLDATIDCLIERGHARTTTSDVCRRAGVSQGALFKHFPSKADLLGATVRHLFAALVDDFRGAFAGVAGEPEPVRVALGLLRETFAQPRLLAAFELYTAARTDDDLRATLAPVMAEHRANLRREARALLPAAPEGPGFDALVDLVMSALQGAALGTLVLADADSEARGLALLEEWVGRELARV